MRFLLPMLFCFEVVLPFFAYAGELNPKDRSYDTSPPQVASITTRLQEALVAEEHKVAEALQLAKEVETIANEEMKELQKARESELYNWNELKDARDQMDMKNREAQEFQRILDDMRVKVAALLMVQEDLMHAWGSHSKYQALHSYYEDANTQKNVLEKALTLYENNSLLRSTVNKASSLVISTLQNDDNPEYQVLVDSLHEGSEEIKRKLSSFRTRPRVSIFQVWVIFPSILCALYGVLIFVASKIARRTPYDILRFWDLHLVVLYSALTILTLYFGQDALRIFFNATPAVYRLTQGAFGSSLVGFLGLRLLVLLRIKHTTQHIRFCQVARLFFSTIILGLYCFHVAFPAMHGDGPSPKDVATVSMLYFLPAFGLLLLYWKDNQGKTNTELPEQQEGAAPNPISGIAFLGWNLPSAPFAGGRKQNKSK